MPTASGYATCSYELKHSTLARSAYLTFGCDPSGTDPSAVATQLRQAFSSAGSIFSTIDSEVSLVATHVALGTDGGEDIVGIDPTVVACTRSGASTPANVSLMIHKRTARGGRRGRGRMYLPWALLTADVSENGQISTGRQASAQTVINAWLSAVNSSAGPVVLLHRPSHDTIGPGSAEGPPNVVTSMTVDPLVATQRRRLGR